MFVFMAVVMIAVSFVPSVSVLDSKYECARVVKYALVVGKSGHLAQWLDFVMHCLDPVCF